MTLKRVLVLCGGMSLEHDISLLSARYIVQNIDQTQYHVMIVVVGQDGQWTHVPYEAFLQGYLSGHSVFLIRKNGQAILWCDTMEYRIDIVFPAIHGTSGEDGSIQGFLEYVGVPYVGNGILSSAVGMDKIATKHILSACAIPIVPFLWACDLAHVPSYDVACQHLETSVLVIKSACSGSSIGVYKVFNALEYEEKTKEAFHYSSRILIEKAVVGFELECAVLGYDHAMASGVGEIVVHNADRMYSYTAKYDDPQERQAQVFLEAQSIDSSTVQRIKDMALQAFKALHCCGLARIDFFATDTDIFINEINTMPGFTSISLYPKLWEKEGIAPGVLIQTLLCYAQQRFNGHSLLKSSKNNSDHQK